MPWVTWLWRTPADFQLTSRRWPGLTSVLCVELSLTKACPVLVVVSWKLPSKEELGPAWIGASVVSIYASNLAFSDMCTQFTSSGAFVEVATTRCLPKLPSEAESRDRSARTGL